MNKDIRRILKQIAIQQDDDFRGLHDYKMTLNELYYELYLLVDEHTNYNSYGDE
jgi:hypothetical protein